MDTPAKGCIYEFGTYCLDTGAGRLYCAADGRSITLTPRVYDTLLFLVEHAGELLDKRRLMGAIWPDVVVEDNNLDQCISTLRQTLGERRGEHRYIVTIRGRGYRFDGDVDQAFVWLERAFEDRSQLLAWLPWDAAFDSIREDPRYPAVAGRLHGTLSR